MHSKRYYPYYAIVSRGIRIACNDAMKTFNMGASAGRPSLEEFKSFWGARKYPTEFVFAKSHVVLNFRDLRENNAVVLSTTTPPVVSRQSRAQHARKGSRRLQVP